MTLDIELVLGRYTMGTNTTIRAAAVQMDIRIGENDANLKRILELLQEAADNGAQLIVFPECALTGYCFSSLDEARELGEPGGSERLRLFSRECGRLNVIGIAGYIQANKSSPDCYNAAEYSGPERTQWNQELQATRRVGYYWKTHLPVLGVDRWVTPGDRFFLHEGPLAKIGILICYDIRFPEAARVLALQGADVIALPTNWPVGAESSPEFIVRTRAWENRVFIVAANRVGVERGRCFIGRSQIVAPSGEILCEAGGEEETIIYADIDIAEARRKRITIEPGEWELDITAHRRPELYGLLAKATNES